MKLISMREFVLEQHEKSLGWFDLNNRCFLYAKFLSQPLKLGMFVPCDLDGNILEEPYDELGRGNWIKTPEKTISEISDKYNEAKERVLFEGAETNPINEHGSYVLNICNYQIGYYKSLPNYFTWHDTIIEGLVGLGIDLTPTAIKQLGL